MQIQVNKNTVIDGIYLAYGETHEVTDEQKAILLKGGFLVDEPTPLAQETKAKAVSKSKKTGKGKADKTEVPTDELDDGVAGIGAADLV